MRIPYIGKLYSIEKPQKSEIFIVFVSIAKMIFMNKKPTKKTTMKNFFISYNQADRQWAEWVAWQLEEADYSTILQAWDFRPGSNFILEMQRAASESERTIAILSKDYLDSLFTQVMFPGQ